VPRVVRWKYCAIIKSHTNKKKKNNNNKSVNKQTHKPTCLKYLKLNATWGRGKGCMQGGIRERGRERVSGGGGEGIDGVYTFHFFPNYRKRVFFSLIPLISLYYIHHSCIYLHTLTPTCEDLHELALWIYIKPKQLQIYNNKSCGLACNTWLSCL